MGKEIETQLRRDVMRHLLASERKTVEVKKLEAVARLALPHESDFGAASRLHELLESLVAEGVLKAFSKVARDKTGRPTKVVRCPTEEEMKKLRENEDLKSRIESTVWVPRMTPVSVDPKIIHNKKIMQKAIAVNAWLKGRQGNVPDIPHRERSLEIFGDEKALEGVARKPLFGGRISLVDLSCFHCPEPLHYEAFSKNGDENQGKPLLVVENANTYWSCCRANAKVGRFAAVVYGKGNMINSLEVGCEALWAVEDALGSVGVYYFGDLDPEGLTIPKGLSDKREKAGLSTVEPERCLYAALIQKNLLTPCNAGQLKHHDPAFAVSWLGTELAEAYLVKAPQERWPQEGLGAGEIEMVLQSIGFPVNGTQAYPTRDA